MMVEHECPLLSTGLKQRKKRRTKSLSTKNIRHCAISHIMGDEHGKNGIGSLFCPLTAHFLHSVFSLGFSKRERFLKGNTSGAKMSKGSHTSRSP